MYCKINSLGHRIGPVEGVGVMMTYSPWSAAALARSSAPAASGVILPRSRPAPPSAPHPFRASAPVFNPFPFSWDHWAWRLYCPRGMFVAPECRHFLLIDRRAWEYKWQPGSYLEGFGSSSHTFFWWFTNKKAIESKAVCPGHQISNNVSKLL